MDKPFFPDLIFGWAFLLTLTVLTILAAYTDLRTRLIPKSVTLTALPLGVLFNVLRGMLLGAQDQAVWRLGAHGGLLGSVDGLLFSLAGFVVGFMLFFILWILGTCGGGDVKLFAALGAWLGPYLTVLVLAGTIVVVLGLTMARIVWTFPTLGMRRTMDRYSRQDQSRVPAGMKPRQRKRTLTYSLPVAVVTAVVLLWAMRVDLHLAAPRPAADIKDDAHAR